MASKLLNINLPPSDSLFSTQAEREDAQAEKVKDIRLSELFPFPEHPFQVRLDEDMNKLVESIKECGVLIPALVREREGGGYEIISGHRRHYASEYANKLTMPCIIRNLTDDEAVIVMVDANLQRERILPSEKAFAYKMKMDAMKRQAGRPSKENRVPVGHDLNSKRSREILAENSPDGATQIQRFIRLTQLNPEILSLVDSGRIAMRPAVEMSYLTQEEQASLLDQIKQNDCTPSQAQAMKMKRYSQEGRLSSDVIASIMDEEKANQKESIRIPTDTLRKYIPKTVPIEKAQDYVLKALEYYQKVQSKKRDSDAR